MIRIRSSGNSGERLPVRCCHAAPLIDAFGWWNPVPICAIHVNVVRISRGLNDRIGNKLDTLLLGLKAIGKFSRHRYSEKVSFDVVDDIT